jgi:uncharacterized BrkB/YihY/UPF0761 family membrane protein
MDYGSSEGGVSSQTPPSRSPVGRSGDPFHPAPHIHVRTWHALWSSVWTSICFLLQTEVHVYAFAVAVNILISFFPFLVAIILLCRSAFHWQGGVDVIIQTVNNYFPEGFGVNFRGYLLDASYQRFSWMSVFLLLFTANGIFTPLEVALNRIWGVRENRSFFRNQVIGLALIFVCGVLVLASVSATTTDVPLLMAAKVGASHSRALIKEVAFRVVAVPMTMLMIFLIYWRLPNARIPIRRLIPAAVIVALLLEGAKYLNILTWPWLRAKLRSEVPPFVQSISIVLWAFFATLIILAGAEWSARVKLENVEDEVGPVTS